MGPPSRPEQARAVKTKAGEPQVAFDRGPSSFLTHPLGPAIYLPAQNTDLQLLFEIGMMGPSPLITSSHRSLFVYSVFPAQRQL